MNDVGKGENAKRAALKQKVPQKSEDTEIGLKQNELKRGRREIMQERIDE